MYNTGSISFASILKDLPARKLQDNILQAGENIIFQDGVIKSRFGIAEFGATSLGDNITGVSLFKKLRNDNRYLIAFTNKDAYVYNVQNGKFELKTRNYSKGTVTSSGDGNRTITLTSNITTTATITNGSNRIVVASPTGLEVGMEISGDGIPDNTTILAISGSVLTLSNPIEKEVSLSGLLTVAGTGIASVSSTNGLAVGMKITGDGLQNDTLISAIGSGTLTLSKASHNSTARTGNTTSGSPNLTAVNDVTGLKIGQSVTGSGIPVGTTIIAINGNVITLSANCTATATSIALNITDTETTALKSKAIGMTGINISAGWALWKNTTWNQADLYKISFESAVQENCNTWYTVKSIDSNKQITLKADLPAAVTASVYTLRLCYAGDGDDAWNSAYPYSNDANDKILLSTNGIDTVQVYTGTGYFEDFTNYPNRAKFVGFWGSVGYEHVLFANVYDTGSAKMFEQTIEWLDAGGDLIFNGGYAELLDSSEAITGVVSLANRLFIYKTNSISIVDINPNGGNDNPFFITQNAVEFGTPSIRTVCNTGQFHIFFTGNDIRLFDGHTTRVVSDGNSQYIISQLNREYQHRSFAFILPEQNLYCLYIPTGESEYCDLCVVYNYISESMTYWKLKDLNGHTFYPLSKGKYTRTYAPRWRDLYVSPIGDITTGSNQITSLSSMAGVSTGMKVKGSGIPDESYITAINGSTIILTSGKNAAETATGAQLKIGWTAAQMNQRWTDLIVDERFTRLIFGDSTGHLYTYAIDFNDDNSYSIDSTFTTKDYDLNQPGYDFRLLECTLAMQLKDGFTPATIDIRASVDFGRTWTQWTTVPLDGNSTYMEKKVNYNMVGKQVRFELRMSNPLIFESMLIGFNAQYKSMKFDN